MTGSFDEVRALIDSKPDDAIIAAHPLATRLQTDYDTTHKWKIKFKNSMPHVSAHGKKGVSTEEAVGILTRELHFLFCDSLFCP